VILGAKEVKVCFLSNLSAKVKNLRVVLFCSPATDKKDVSISFFLLEKYLRSAKPVLLST